MVNFRPSADRRRFDVPARIAAVGDGAEMGRSDLRRVFLQRAGKRDVARARLPGGAAARQLGILQQHIEPARRGVDAHAVAVAQERNRSAGGSLGRKIADA